MARKKRNTLRFPKVTVLPIQGVGVSDIEKKMSDCLSNCLPTDRSLVVLGYVFFEEAFDAIQIHQPDVILVGVRPQDLEALSRLYTLLGQTGNYQPPIFTFFLDTDGNLNTSETTESAPEPKYTLDYFLSLARKPPPMN